MQLNGATSQGPSATEQQRAENAEKQISEAIRKSDRLRHRNIKVFTQGSYRNRVNVKKDSDVDIGVLCFDTFFPQYLNDDIRAMVGVSLEPAEYSYLTFKDELEAALVERFGRANVTRGHKAFNVRENTYRVEADVAPFFEYRFYYSTSDYYSGVQMMPDNSLLLRIINWPEQHYTSGVNKNTATNRQFKRVVRILKSLSNEMSSNGIRSAEKAPSFLIECLVWNAPNSCFQYSTHRGRVRAVLVRIFNNTRSDDECKEWREVSERKYLFRDWQPWTRKDAHNFISNAWDYVGYDK